MHVREFFGPRAAGWDERFPDDGPAYAAAVAAMGLARGSVVVDVGCGTGRALPCLAAAGAVAIGVDVTPEMLAVARSRSSLLLEGDGLALPLRTASVDAVFAAGYVSHLDDPEAGLRELARVVRPGGLLAIFHPIGRSALAARHGRALDGSELLDGRNLPDALASTGWSLTSLDDGEDRYLAVAARAEP